MTLPALDARLRAAYDLIAPCGAYADIGADHGLLPLHLIAQGDVQSAIVADISAPALEKAKAAFTRHGMADRVSFIIADGLNALNAPMDVISILGMGGDTLLRILKSGQGKLHGAALILSPHTDLYKVRQGISGMGYALLKETLVFERRRFYVLLKAVPGPSRYGEAALFLGPCLLRDRPPLFLDYLKWRQKVAKAAHSAELDYVEEALRCW